MAAIGTIVIYVTDAQRAAEFWARALGYVGRADNPLILVPRDGSGPAVALDETDRMHLDLSTASAQEPLHERVMGTRSDISSLLGSGALRDDVWLSRMREPIRA